MGAGIQRWWRDPDALQRECDAFDGKQPDIADHVEWWRERIRQHWAELAMTPLIPEPRFDPPPIDDSITMTLRTWAWWCPICKCYDSWPHFNGHGIFTIVD